MRTGWIDDELIVRIGKWERNMSLPLGLAKLEIGSTKYVEDRLNILFKIETETSLVAPEALQITAWQNLLSCVGGNSGSNGK